MSFPAVAAQVQVQPMKAAPSEERTLEVVAEHHQCAFCSGSMNAAATVGFSTTCAKTTNSQQFQIYKHCVLQSKYCVHLTSISQFMNKLSVCIVILCQLSTYMLRQWQALSVPCSHLVTGFPLSCLEKIPGLFQDFPGPPKRFSPGCSTLHMRY